MEEENKTTTTTDIEESLVKKDKAVFISRLIAFIIFGAIAPVCFIMWRYGIFTSGEVKFTMAGWGLIASLIVFIVIRYVMKEVSDVMPSSLFTQVVNGFMRVILPLLLVYFLLNSLKDSLDLLIQSVLAVILCESVAIVVNPFPKWKLDHKVDEKTKSFGDFARIFVKTWKGDK